MSKYCCFFDPAKDYEDKQLSDLCPVCKRPYGYILDNPPSTIEFGNKLYNVIKPIGRGFYGATFLCEVKKRFTSERVLLKVIPVKLYEFFGKDFDSECEIHDSVAKNTEHLVKINDAFQTDITFGAETISCHVAELQYVNGISLLKYISDDAHTSAKIYAQITIDLLMIWNELFQKREFHNDLHLENIMVEQLDQEYHRVDAIYDRIRLIAIDLNSVSDGSLSDSTGRRIGDRRYISNHIDMLSKRLRSLYDDINDMKSTDYRIMMAMNKISSIFAVPLHSADQPEISELVNLVKNEFKSNVSYAPWLQTFTLSRLTDAINAQTLPSCFVPRLLIDPDNRWIHKISIREPQLIIGMRGCGKTMLLKALDIHARLNSQEDKNKLQSLIDDKYVGIMASCREIFKVSDIRREGISKLILLYSIEILRAARHIHDLDANKVIKDFHIVVADALETIFSFSIDKNLLLSDYIFEKYISDLSNDIEDFCQDHSIRVPCITAFELLANALNTVSELIQNKTVFFLLDDASTRYIELDDIGLLLTSLIFMSEKCAFKVTTEMQTISGFRSPGNIEESREIRDYAVFDLGADVYDKTRDKKKAKLFIEQIINKRLAVCSGYENIPQKLSDVLGDTDLISIADYIINHHSTTKEKTNTYHGATALVSLCVGDIGDVIGLYDSILDRNGGKRFPVPNDIQSVAFQRLCTHRMYSLEGKNTMVLNCAKAFAEASNYDLLNSRKAITKNGTNPKIRQYNHLHISNVTSDKQYQYIRKLVDSGVFVYSDANGRSRKKDRQIKLAFRKLFGLSYFIPLGDSDRYELSGDAFEKWVENPSRQILNKNAGNDGRESALDASDSSKTDKSDNTGTVNDQLKKITGYHQMTLNDISPLVADNAYNVDVREKLIESIISSVGIYQISPLIENDYFEVAVFGLGFEDRCLKSIERVIENNKIGRIVFIRYTEKGHSEEILSIAKNNSIDYVVFDYCDIKAIVAQISPFSRVLLDVTGTYKPIIFSVIRHTLNISKEIVIIHTMAEEYYPLNSDIKPLLDQADINDNNIFTNIVKQLTTGDEGEYTNVKLVSDNNFDPVRPKSLLGFVSPKNQRIYNLLDEMDFEKVVLLVPIGETSRDILSNTAGNIAEINYSGVSVNKIDLTDPENVFKEIVKCYVDLYIEQGSNFEIALTGSKMQAVVAAVFSSIAQITQCWYVEPSRFDTKHFTRGVGETRCYRIVIER